MAEGRKPGWSLGKLPDIFNKMKDEEIVELALTGSSENDALLSIGVTQLQADKIKTTKRWRSNWDKGVAQWKILQNKKIMKSKDSSTLKLIAERTLPQNDIGAKLEFVVDAPKWFLDGLKNESKNRNKRKSV